MDNLRRSGYRVSFIVRRNENDEIVFDKDIPSSRSNGVKIS